MTQYSFFDGLIVFSWPAWDLAILASCGFMIFCLGKFSNAAGIHWGNQLWTFTGIMDALLFHIRGDTDGRSQLVIFIPISYCFGYSAGKILFTNDYKQGVDVWRNCSVVFLSVTGGWAALWYGIPNREAPSASAYGFYFIHAWAHFAAIATCVWAITLHRRGVDQYGVSPDLSKVTRSPLRVLQDVVRRVISRRNLPVDSEDDEARQVTPQKPPRAEAALAVQTPPQAPREAAQLVASAPAPATPASARRRRRRN